MTTTTPNSAPTRQITLPLSKAVEISWKSIRLRLTRSMLVTSAITLALAFLCSILTTETIIDGMRTWTVDWPKGKEAADLKRQREQADTDFNALASVLRFEADEAKPAKDAAKFNPKDSLGDDWDAIRADVGTLAIPAPDLTKLLTAKPDKLGDVKKSIDLARKRKELRLTLNRPEDLKAAMTSRGVPTEPADIAANRVQTRWVIGLALLVAFVGILNAMVMSVRERFREIGTMKCLGALDGFIVKLFLLESLFQGVVGTLLGIVLGLLISFAMAMLSYGGAVFYHPNWGQIGINVVVTLVAGLVLSVGGAVIPCLQAARMEPIEAMRTEA
ncbi:MAG: FtsX-like permease family protein [Tepidisphaeraceae bacterium]